MPGDEAAPIAIPAVAYGPTRPTSGSRVRVEIGSTALLVFDADAPGRREEVPLERVRCRAGGWHGAGLLLEWGEAETAQAIAVRDPEALERAAPDALRDRLAPWRDARRRRRRSRVTALAATLVVLATIVAIAIVAIRAAGGLVDAAVDRVSPATEARFGDALAAQIESTSKARPDGEATRAVAAIGTRIGSAAEAPFPLRFRVLDDPQVNAMAIPGGRVFVFTGLLREAESAEEVAGVLAHEVGHVVARHSLHAVVRSLGLRTAFGVVFGSGNDLAGRASEAAAQLLDLRFTREQELEADERGLRLLERAGISTSGMASFFERMASESEPPEILSTHPASSDRAVRIRKLAAADERREPLPIDWSRVRDELRPTAESGR